MKKAGREPLPGSRLPAVWRSPAPARYNRQPEEALEADLEEILETDAADSLDDYAAAADVLEPEILETEGEPPPRPSSGREIDLLNEPAPAIRTWHLDLPAGTPLLPFHSRGDARVGEEYRMIRTKVIQHPAQPRLMVVSSAGPHDGKTLNAINLSGALALKRDHEVLLMDGDLRRFGVTKALRLPESLGLVDVLSNACRLEEALVRLSDYPSLYVLPAGRARSNPAELLDSPLWKELCEELRERFRFTIIDAPPIAAVADYDLLQAFCDGVILVLRVDHSNRDACRSVIESIPPEKLLGAIVNCPDEWSLRKSHHYYYYSTETS
jgi:capsular exopolysaccharide synthesis family protein